jgi:hypothetical protein
MPPIIVNLLLIPRGDPFVAALSPQQLTAKTAAARDFLIAPPQVLEFASLPPKVELDRAIRLRLTQLELYAELVAAAVSCDRRYASALPFQSRRTGAPAATASHAFALEMEPSPTVVRPYPSDVSGVDRTAASIGSAHTNTIEIQYESQQRVPNAVPMPSLTAPSPLSELEVWDVVMGEQSAAWKPFYSSAQLKPGIFLRLFSIGNDDSITPRVTPAQDITAYFADPQRLPAASPGALTFSSVSARPVGLGLVTGFHPGSSVGPMATMSSCVGDSTPGFANQCSTVKGVNPRVEVPFSAAVLREIFDDMDVQRRDAVSIGDIHDAFVRHGVAFLPSTAGRLCSLHEDARRAAVGYSAAAWDGRFEIRHPRADPTIVPLHTSRAASRCDYHPDTGRLYRFDEWVQLASECLPSPLPPAGDVYGSRTASPVHLLYTGALRARATRARQVPASKVLPSTRNLLNLPVAHADRTFRGDAGSTIDNSFAAGRTAAAVGASETAQAQAALRLRPTAAGSDFAAMNDTRSADSPHSWRNSGTVGRGLLDPSRSSLSSTTRPLVSASADPAATECANSTALPDYLFRITAAERLLTASAANAAKRRAERTAATVLRREMDEYDTARRWLADAPKVQYEASAAATRTRTHAGRGTPVAVAPPHCSDGLHPEPTAATDLYA